MPAGFSSEKSFQLLKARPVLLATDSPWKRRRFWHCPCRPQTVSIASDFAGSLQNHKDGTAARLDPNLLPPEFHSHAETSSPGCRIHFFRMGAVFHGGLGCRPFPRRTVGQNRKKHRMNSHLINHFPTSEGVSEVSERANE